MKYKFSSWDKINERLSNEDRIFINQLKEELFYFSEIFYDNSRILEGSFSRDQIRKYADKFREWYSHWPVLEIEDSKLKKPPITLSQNEMDGSTHWVQLTKWSKHFSYPTQGTMRNIVARRKENGATYFVSMVNNRCYIHVDRFNEWMETHREAKQ